jgi:hypothetical protein
VVLTALPAPERHVLVGLGRPCRRGIGRRDHLRRLTIGIRLGRLVDVEPTPARTYDEALATRTMIKRTAKCFDLKPKRLAIRPLAEKRFTASEWPRHG